MYVSTMETRIPQGWILSPKEGAGITQEIFFMISELNMVEDDISWLIHLGVTKHMCKYTSFLKTFESIEDCSMLYMFVQIK